MIKKVRETDSSFAPSCHKIKLGHLEFLLINKYNYIKIKMQLVWF